jgi:hypothetical protein
MPIYKNLGGDSGVRAYEVGEHSINVTFKDGMRYLYTDASAGHASVEEMKRRAEAGVGLNSYITRVVKKGYETKGR